MAKNNNFQDFVTDIANAIRIKNNSNELLNPQDFYNEILKIGGYTDYKNIEYLEVEYNVTTTASTTTLFYNFSNFTSVYIDGQMVSSVSKNYQFSKTGKHYVRYYGMTSIPNNAFYQCKNIISVAISKNITSIGNYAFYHCDSLEKVVMGDSVRSIGDIAFSYCKSLESIELSSGLTSIGGSCFYECNSLIEVICRAKNAPTWGDHSVFYSIGNRGKLIHPMNSDYSSWMLFLSYFNWNEVESNFTDNPIFEGSDIIVESVQQFTTHIGNSIRKVKGFNDNLMINPQDYYNLILSINKSFINAKDTVAGDICILVNGEKKFVKSEDLHMYKYYTPIGVVVVPGIHNVYGDNACGVMSLVSMDISNSEKGDKRILTANPHTMLVDENGDVNSTLLHWGQSNIDNESLRNLRYCLSTDNQENEAISIKTYVYLPSNVYEGTSCYKDSDTYYSSVDMFGVTPYLSDDSRNDMYYSTEINENNALAYFNGKENTEILLNLHTIDNLNTTITITNDSGSTSAPAAAICYLYHTEGTKKGDWYLPSTAEFGYIIPKLGDIQNSLQKIQTVYDKLYAVQLNIKNTSDDKRYWNSTEYNGEGARAVDVRNGYVINNYKSNTNYVRAFLKVK